VPSELEFCNYRLARGQENDESWALDKIKKEMERESANVVVDSNFLVSRIT
jgi:hypothetical protein